MKFEPMTYVVDKIFPRRKVHVIAGPSGSGKTTLIFNIIRDWSIGAPVFGHTSNPEPYLYLSLDRDYDEVGDRILAAGLDPEMVNLLCILDEDMTINKMMAQVPPETKVLFIDGFIRLCPGGRLNDYRTVSNFCLQLARIAKERDITFFIVAHATKVKEGESFLHARHRVIGSVAWGGYSSTLLFIDELTAGKVDDPRRKIEILPRCAKAEEHIYVQDPTTGGLVPSSLEIIVEEHMKFYYSIPFDKEVPTKDLIDLAEKVGISRATAFRIINDWVNAGQLERRGTGVYVRKLSDHPTADDKGLPPQSKT